MPLGPDEDSVTPVVGSILILAITIMGISAVLLWGGPALQQIQDENAAVGMLGEFREIRRDTKVLTIADSSRVPEVNLDRGSFGIGEGTRFLITSMHDSSNTGCDFLVYGWEDSDVDTFQYEASGCRGSLCAPPGAAGFEVFRVTGTNVVEVTGLSFSLAGGVCTVDLPGGNDLSSGDWLFQISNGGTSDYAQAWLIETQAIEWEYQGADEQGLWLEAGAIISADAGTFFREEHPFLNDEAFGTEDVVLRLPAYTGSQDTQSGRATPSLFLGLVGNYLRVSEDSVYTLRYTFDGDRAQAWCNTLLARDDSLTNHAYTTDPTFPCDGTTDLRAVTYAHDTNPTTDPFPFDFLHARITTSLQL